MLPGPTTTAPGPGDPERDAQENWPEELTACQVRIAGSTDRLAAVTACYVDGLGRPGSEDSRDTTTTTG